MEDTSAAGSRRYFELLRARSPADRAKIMIGLTSAVRQLAEAGERERHPLASDRELKARVAARLYGRETAARFFPDVSVD